MPGAVSHKVVLKLTVFANRAKIGESGLENMPKLNVRTREEEMYASRQ
jgi:hypothetical protein